MTETFYEVLEVAEDATQGEITEAYRQKVKEYHPDTADREDTTETFKRVVRAEEVLTDAEERARYDRLGHDTYVRLADAEVVPGHEEPTSTWAPGDSHDAGFGGVGPREAASTTAGASSTARTSRSGTRTAGGVGDADASMGFGRAASRQSSAGWSDDTDSHNRWSNDDGADYTYAVRDWDDGVPAPDTVTIAFTQQFAIFALALFVLYPMILYVALSPAFSPILNIFGAALTVVVVGYSLTVPKLSLVAFGGWFVLAPLGVLFVAEWGMWFELLAVTLCWIPFGYAVVVAYFTRPS